MYVIIYVYNYIYIYHDKIIVADKSSCVNEHGSKNSHLYDELPQGVVYNPFSISIATRCVLGLVAVIYVRVYLYIILNAQARLRFYYSSTNLKDNTKDFNHSICCRCAKYRYTVNTITIYFHYSCHSYSSTLGFPFE